MVEQSIRTLYRLDAEDVAGDFSLVIVHRSGPAYFSANLGVGVGKRAQGFINPGQMVNDTGSYARPRGATTLLPDWTAVGNS